ncbi:hypothetical protein DXM26_16875 [Agrobacterium tumefaciens]|nr:hypothetical protein DXM26_16875 [Agrobacterium tumefaciens]
MPRVLFCLVLLMATAIDASATEEYPCKPDPDGGKWAWGRIQQMDHSYLVKRQVGPHRFEIPYGYHIGRRTPERVNCYPIRDSIEFAFWMPDLRSPRNDMWSEPDYRVQEEGRPVPSAREYVVQILATKYIPEGSTKPTPAEGFHNLTLPTQKTDERYGLTHTLPDADAGEMDTYVSSSDPRYEILLLCLKPEQNYFPYPSCKTYLYLTDLRLELVLIFPTDALPEWRKVVEGVHTLITRWRTDG